MRNTSGENKEGEKNIIIISKKSRESRTISQKDFSLSPEIFFTAFSCLAAITRKRRQLLQKHKLNFRGTYLYPVLPLFHLIPPCFCMKWKSNSCICLYLSTWRLNENQSGFIWWMMKMRLCWIAKQTPFPQLVVLLQGNTPVFLENLW